MVSDTVSVVEQLMPHFVVADGMYELLIGEAFSVNLNAL
jgi:hypothetical protein